MILHIFRDAHGYVVEPHGEEPVAWTCDVKGGDVLRAAGWVPYEMHRVSVFVVEQIVSEGFLKVLYDRSRVQTG
jgi:hypothetical protein